VRITARIFIVLDPDHSEYPYAGYLPASISANSLDMASSMIPLIDTLFAFAIVRVASRFIGLTYMLVIVLSPLVPFLCLRGIFPMSSMIVIHIVLFYARAFVGGPSS
jgi:hypothetical protein